MITKFFECFSSKSSEVSDLSDLSTLLHVESIHHLEADVLQASLLCQATSSLSLPEKWGKEPMISDDHRNSTTNTGNERRFFTQKISQEHLQHFAPSQWNQTPPAPVRVWCLQPLHQGIAWRESWDSSESSMLDWFQVNAFQLQIWLTCVCV